MCLRVYVNVGSGGRENKCEMLKVDEYGTVSREIFYYSCNNFLGLQVFQNKKLKHGNRKILGILAHFSRWTSQSFCLWFALIILLKVLLPVVLARSDIIKIFLNRHMVILIIYWDLLFTLSRPSLSIPEHCCSLTVVAYDQ